MNDNNSFSSIDRLMEFGMSMAVAQQMVNTMNNCMANMHVPGQPTASPQSAAGYHVSANGSVAGPFTLEELGTLAKAKTLTADTLVWKPGMTGWVLAASIPEVNKYLLLNPANTQSP